MVINGSTSSLSRSYSNLIVLVSFPLFIEILQSDLNRQITSNFADEIEDIIPCLTARVGINKIFSFFYRTPAMVCRMCENSCGINC